jgi:GT2 family glycosyltransferase
VNGRHRVTVVIITRDRRDSLRHTLRRLHELPDAPPVIVVDNGSSDGTAAAVRDGWPDVTLLRFRDNLGAVGRNHAVRRVTTPYVAFCDDDSWWAPGSFERAADALDAHPGLAAVTGRIVVEPDGVEDGIVAELRDSPLAGPPWLPGPALGSVLAAATVLRVAAFRQVGGFSSRLWLGGEEELLSIELLARGWWLCHLPDIAAHHRAAPRDLDRRRRLGLRNTVWCAWLRRPLLPALRRTGRLLRAARRDTVSLRALADAAVGLPGVLRARRVVPPHVAAMLDTLEIAQWRSRSRRY